MRRQGRERNVVRCPAMRTPATSDLWRGFASPVSEVALSPLDLQVPADGRYSHAAEVPGAKPGWAAAASCSAQPPDGHHCDFPAQQDEAHCSVVSLPVVAQDGEAEHCALRFLGGEYTAAARSDAELVRCFLVCWGAAVEHCARAYQETEPADARWY